MRRAISPSLVNPKITTLPFIGYKFLLHSSKFRAMSTTNMGNGQDSRTMSNSKANTRNFDKYFETFNTIYAPAVKEVKELKEFERNKYQIPHTIDMLSGSLSSIRSRGKFPITTETKSEVYSDNDIGLLRRYVGKSIDSNYVFQSEAYTDSDLKSLFNHVTDLNYIFHLVSKNDRARFESENKLKPFQYSLFNLVTAIEVELFGNNLIKPGPLVSECYYPDEFYKRYVIEEFQDRHGLIADPMRRIVDIGVDILSNSNRIIERHIEFNRSLEVFTKIYAPMMEKIDLRYNSTTPGKMSYYIERFRNTVLFLRALSATSYWMGRFAKYYGHILSYFISVIDRTALKIMSSSELTTLPDRKDVEKFLHSLAHLVHCIELDIFDDYYNFLSKDCSRPHYRWDRHRWGNKAIIREFYNNLNDGYDGRFKHSNFVFGHLFTTDHK